MRSVVWTTLATAMVTIMMGSKASGAWLDNGGKWMPQQMPDNAAILKELGIQIDPADLSDPSSKLMQSIVWLGGCSGAFISKSGLIATNHHCVQGILSHLAKQAQQKGQPKDFTKDGYLANRRAEELNGGPSQRIYITQEFVNVSDRVLNGLELIADPAARKKEVDRRITLIQAEAEKDRADIRADVVPFFQEEQFFLIVKKEIKDVRLVFAPGNGVGTFGGDDDNWQWPRHTGDFSLIRAYVAPNGDSAVYSADNVPYEPKEHLKISAKGVKPDDLVMVAGYPGRSYRLFTADQVDFQLNTEMPFTIAKLSELIGTMDELSKESEEYRIKLEDRRHSFMNAILKYQGSVRGLKEIDYLSQRKASEAQLQAWIDADPARQAKYGNILQQMSQLRSKYRGDFETRALFGLMTSQVLLLRSALTIVRMAQERPKADADRRLAYQEREWIRLRQTEQSMQFGYSRHVDLVFLKGFVKELGLTDLDAKLENYYAGTQLENLEERLRLLDHASIQDLEGSTDTMIQLALHLSKTSDRYNAEMDAEFGSLLLLTPKYVQALREQAEGRLAPDANSTLRITFGQVKGTKDTQPITTTDEMLRKVEKHGFQPPYAPAVEVLAAAHKRDFGIYGDTTYNVMPLDVLATVDITGGNSGSSTLNAKGEMVGLMFDGTSHTLYNDWYFDENVRAIFVDNRYLLWMLDKVYNAQNILQELDIVYPEGCTQMLSSAESKE